MNIRRGMVKTIEGGCQCTECYRDMSAVFVVRSSSG